MDRPIVFLHLPKTGGQNVHHAVAALVGAQNTSPLRLQAQVKKGPAFPPGYRFHSGHLHWSELDSLPGDPFVFTVLRDPRERLGSYFFYMREVARERCDPEKPDATPLFGRLLASADQTFFMKDGRFHPLIQAQWSNLTTTYLAHRQLMRPKDEMATPSERIARALENSRQITLYGFGDFAHLETDLEAVLGVRPQIVGKRRNPGPLPKEQSRWQAMLAEIDGEDRRRQMEALVAEDEELMSRLDFRR